MFRILFATALILIAPAVMAQGMTMQHAGSGPPSSRAYNAAMAKMMRSMHATPTGDPDSDFVTMMIPHHEGAIEMAEVELKYGKDPQLLTLARQIVADQTREIGDMQAWLKAHGK